MIRRSRSLAIALAVLGAAAIYFLVDARRTPSGESPSAARAPDESAETLKRVKVAAVEVTRERRELRFSGTTRAARRARLAFSVGGRMVARPVEIGDRVERGQLLAKLDDHEVDNAVASARAALAELEARRAQSERDRARAEQLAAAKAATSEELERTAAAVDAVRAAEDAAEARLAEAERRKRETRLAAPFAGTVTDVLFEPGEYLRAGSPVVSLSGVGAVEVEIEVPESVIPRIAVGDEVKLLLPVLGRDAVTGRIESVGRTAAGPGRLFPVVAAVSAADELLAGATAELVLELVSDDALALPVEAVVNPGGRRPSVFRVLGEASGPRRVEKVPVEIGTLLSGGDGVGSDGVGGDGVGSDPVRVIVRGELSGGDLVVVGGQRGLLDGETVEVAGVER